jgi:hypothetical protein
MVADVISSGMYRINPGDMVSKYAGETGKNLRRVQDAAKQGILSCCSMGRTPFSARVAG